MSDSGSPKETEQSSPDQAQQTDQSPPHQAVETEQSPDSAQETQNSPDQALETEKSPDQQDEAEHSSDQESEKEPTDTPASPAEEIITRLDSSSESGESDKDDDDKDDDDDDDDGAKGSEKEKKSEQDEEEGEEEEEEQEDEVFDPEPAKVYDFDIMMAQKKAGRAKRKRDSFVIDDKDDIIVDIISQMRAACEQDQEANANRKAATAKIKLLPLIASQLKKVNLRDAFLDSDVLSAITDWLAPLPDKSLPHLTIRDTLLRILIELNISDIDRIKSSNVGKAVMYLYKHPRETKENKQRAKHLISCWSRPIFNHDTDFTSREEREEMDIRRYETIKRHRGEQPSSSSGRTRDEPDPATKPGDKGWIPRARVPAVSLRDYVNRPESKVEGEVSRSSKRPANMLEKYLKTQQDRRRASRKQQAVSMKIDRV